MVGDEDREAKALAVQAAYEAMVAAHESAMAAQTQDDMRKAKLAFAKAEGELEAARMAGKPFLYRLFSKLMR